MIRKLYQMAFLRLEEFPPASNSSGTSIFLRRGVMNGRHQPHRSSAPGSEVVENPAEPLAVGVRVYSTRGGTSGYIVRFTAPDRTVPACGGARSAPWPCLVPRHAGCSPSVSIWKGPFALVRSSRVSPSNGRVDAGIARPIVHAQKAGTMNDTACTVFAPQRINPAFARAFNSRRVEHLLALYGPEAQSVRPDGQVDLGMERRCGRTCRACRALTVR